MKQTSFTCDRGGDLPEELHNICSACDSHAPLERMMTLSARPVAVVAEDESLLRMDTVDMLEDMGFEVLEACHAAQAVKHLENRSDVALLYTDVYMPGAMCGRDLAHLCAERWPHTRIIVCSACHSSEAASLPRVAHFIPKPCIQSLVRNALQALRLN